MFNRSSVKLCLALLVWASSLSAQPVLGPPTPVPENATITLSADRDEYFLGENILVHFTVANTGGPAFQAEFGGDYRGASRSLRFIVTATDENGHAVADPYPDNICMGGFVHPASVTTEKPFHASLPILRYLLIEAPGTYTVSVRHDCGWIEPAEGGYPEARITLRLKRPSAEQAAELVKAWLAEPPYGGDFSGQKSYPHADFSVIRSPEYLEPLARHAAEGNENALIGVGSIATPEATSILIDLLDTGDDEFRAEVRRQLGSRLPDPYLEGLLDRRNVFEQTMETTRSRLVRESWRPEFADKIRTHAARYLEDERTDRVSAGAFFIECVGQPSDAQRIEEALDREIHRTQLETRRYPRPPGACGELLRAVRVLLARGAEAPTEPTSPGQAIFFLLALKNDPNFRPDGWLDTCDRLLAGEIPYLQEQTLIALPEPMPESLRRHLGAILASDNVDASIEACRIVQRDRLLDQTKAVARVCRTANEEWLFRAAGDAMHALDANYECLEILVSRLDEPDRMYDALSAIKSIVFDNTGGGGHSTNINMEAEGRRIKPLWQAFIGTHEQRIKDGRRFTLPDPHVPATMFPPEYSITLKNGQRWP